MPTPSPLPRPRRAAAAATPVAVDASSDRGAVLDAVDLVLVRAVLAGADDPDLGALPTPDAVRDVVVARLSAAARQRLRRAGDEVLAWAGEAEARLHADLVAVAGAAWRREAALAVAMAIVERAARLERIADVADADDGVVCFDCAQRPGEILADGFPDPYASGALAAA